MYEVHTNFGSAVFSSEIDALSALTLLLPYEGRTEIDLEHVVEDIHLDGEWNDKESRLAVLRAPERRFSS